MEALVGGSWDEQFFYRNFYIYGCGGMFGTELHLKDEEACRSETASISVTTDAKGEPTGAVPMVFSCCEPRRLRMDEQRIAALVRGSPTAL